MKHNKIKSAVNKYGLVTTLEIFGGNKDVIRQAYEDNPESYLDYLIGNILVVKQPVTDKICFVHTETNYQIMFECYRTEFEFQKEGYVVVNDFIWNYFFLNVMNYTNVKTQQIIQSWLSKHIPNIKHLIPISKSNVYATNM
jgi:hypothetical protein